MSGGFVAALSIANLGIWLAFFTPIVNLLPRLVEDLTGPHGKETALGWVTGVGALVAIIANPLAGAMSDRTTSRFGRRRPWVFGGALVGMVALFVLAGQTTIAGLVVVWAVAQAAINSSYAAVTAAIPDQVPVVQRGTVSGWIGLTQSLGVVAGVAVVTALVLDLSAGTIVIGVLYFTLVLPFVLRTHDPVLSRSDRPTFAWRGFFAAFWVDPHRFPDFWWAWITRFLVSLGNAMATLYLLYFLKDQVHYPNPEQGQLILILVYTLGIVVTAVVGGRLSDRSGRRKVYVVWSTVVMAAAAVLLAFFPTWAMTVLAAAVLGLGFGVYLGVDQALITQVLPSDSDRGRDLGVINVANSAPQVLAPALAAPLVSSVVGYPGLYTVTAVVTLLGALLVLPIRSVR